MKFQLKHACDEAGIETCKVIAEMQAEIERLEAVIDGNPMKPYRYTNKDTYPPRDDVYLIYQENVGIIKSHWIPEICWNDSVLYWCEAPKEES